MPVESTACPLDCPDACSLDVTVEDGRVTKIDGNFVNPVTEGFICAKIRHFDEHMYCPERLLYPGIRDGAKGEGGFRQASWDEALDLIALKMKQVIQDRGAEAILPFYYGGSNGMLTQDATDARLFRRLGTSRLLTTVCAVPTSMAADGLYGKMPGVAYADYLDSKLIVVWGVNPSATGVHIVPKIQESQKAGAKLVVIDPVETPLARRADLHLAVKPGTDLPLALGLIHWLFETGAADTGFLARHAAEVDELRNRASVWTLEAASKECGLDLKDVQKLAGWYAETSPAVIRCGWGLERNRNGGSAAAAVLALPAVAGKFGVRGGGYTMSNSKAMNIAATIEDPEPDTREVNMNRLGRTLLSTGDDRVDFMFVYNANPLQTIPDQEKVRRGMERDDLFTVVFDQVMTDSARYADVVLPATTFLEHEELSRGYGAMLLQNGQPVVTPVGESRPNYDVFADLCNRMGVTRSGDVVGSKALVDDVLRRTDGGKALKASLRDTGRALPDFGDRPVQFVDIFPRTSDGKIHLCPGDLSKNALGGFYKFKPDPATRQHPLALVSPATDKMISSTLGQLVDKPYPLEIHPDDAASRGIRGDDRVRVFNDLGEVICRAAVTTRVRSGVVLLPKGLWSRHTENGAAATALAPDSYTDIGDGACFNDARVEVEKA